MDNFKRCFTTTTWSYGNEKTLTLMQEPEQRRNKGIPQQEMEGMKGVKEMRECDERERDVLLL